jgi:hypothetical protein
MVCYSIHSGVCSCFDLFSLPEIVGLGCVLQWSSPTKRRNFNGVQIRRGYGNIVEETSGRCRKKGRRG